MRRVVPLVILVLAVAAWMFRDVWSGGEPAMAFRDDRVRQVEEMLQNQDVDGARRVLKSAQGLNEAERAYGESVIAFSAGDAETALEQVRIARAAAPGAWRPLSIEVAALMALDRGAKVGTTVRAALDAAPDDERVLAMAAHHFAGSDTDRDPRRALVLLDRIDALPQRRAPEGDATAVQEQTLVVTRYTAAMATGAFGTARAAAQRLIEISGGDPAALVLAGEAARRDGDPVEALKRYRAAVDRAPTARPWQEHLVQLLLELPGGEEEALERTSVMLRTWPQERSVRVLRARALVRSEKRIADGPDRAATIYRGILREHPDDLEALRNLALILYDWKQGGQDGTYLDESHALLRRYVLRGGEIDARIGRTWQILEERARKAAAALGDSDLPEKAAFERTPGDAVAAEDYRNALVTAGRVEEAGRVVRAALDAAPEDPGVHAFAARHFLDEGPDHDAVAALHHLDVAAERLGGEERLSEALLWARCRALGLSRRHSESLEIARRLIAARPSAVPYLVAGARAALELGRFAEAEAWLRDALLLDDRPELRELLERAIGGGDQ